MDDARADQWVAIEEAEGEAASAEVEICLRGAGVRVRVVPPDTASDTGDRLWVVMIPETELELALEALEELDEADL